MSVARCRPEPPDRWSRRRVMAGISALGVTLVSGRSGFKSPLPDYAPSIDSLKLIGVDWQSLSTEKLKVLRDEWTAVFNP